MQFLASAAEMRELDRMTIERVGIAGIVLMESAGIGVVQALRRHLGGPIERLPIGVVCGGGGNGGDGFVVARYLWNQGADVRVYLLADRDRIQGDARTNLGIVMRMGIPICSTLEGISGERVLIDALLGTGLKSEVSGTLRTAIERMNEAPALRVAVDVPSGIDADTGHPRGVCIHATLTVTMGLPKIGLVTAPGFEFAGKLEVVDIGIPRELPAQSQLRTFLLEESDMRPIVPVRPLNAHKGTFGHLLVVAGSQGRTGAALLCGSAALRSGAGLVTVAARPGVESVLAGRVPELMTAPCEDEAALFALASGKRAVALGPGIPTDDKMRALVRRVAVELEAPMIIDADGLNALAGAIDSLGQAKGPRLLTPHPGEAARLLDTDIRAVEANRVETARMLAKRSHAVVALKGARTVVATPSGKAYINPTGNPALATAGTGDVLSGLTGGLLAQGVEPLNALCLAVYAHGRAADLAVGRTKVPRGLLARDVIDQLGAALSF